MKFNLFSCVKISIAFGLAISSTVSAQVVLGPEWGENSHEVLEGDYNGDGLPDLYLKGLEVFVPIAGDILIPIYIDPHKPMVLLNTSSNACIEPFDLIQNPNESTLANGNWVASDFKLHTGDFDGDDKDDFFVQGGAACDASLVLLRDAAGSTAITQTFNDDSIVASVASISVGDLNGDGRDDLSISSSAPGGSQLAFSNAQGDFPTITGSTSSTPGQFVALTQSNSGVDHLGSANVMIPIAVPPGINGFQPRLSLSYSSATGNKLLGMGWSLKGLSIVHRCKPTIAQDGFVEAYPWSSDELYCIDGQKLIAVNGGVYGAANTEYRTELNPFARIISKGNSSGQPDYFEVTNKSGQIFQYGNSTDSKVEAEKQDGTIVKWAVNRAEDVYGNFYAVSYFENTSSGEFYPLRIDYGGNDLQGVASSSSVRFEYIDRPSGTSQQRSDRQIRFKGDSLIQHKKSLNKITTYNDVKKVRDYELSYEYGTVTGRSRISQIEECGYDVAGIIKECAKPTTFDWQEGQQGFNNPVSLGLPSLTGSGQPISADINGDGYKDVLWSEPMAGENFSTWCYSLGGPDGLTLPYIKTPTPIGAQPKFWGLAKPIKLGKRHPRLPDGFGTIDNSKPLIDDGEEGLLVAHYQFAEERIDWFILPFKDFTNPSDVSARPKQLLFPSFGQVPVIADLNGDGRQDILQLVEAAQEPEVGWLRRDAPLDRLGVVANDPLEIVLPQSTSSLYSGINGEIDFYGALVGDLDGDGLDDILAKKHSGSKGRWLITSDSADLTNDIKRIDSGLPYGDGSFGNGVLIDVNSDGLSDFVVMVNGTWRIYVNMGGVINSGKSIKWAPSFDTGITSINPARTLPIDFDGDQKIDLLVEKADGTWRILVSTLETQSDGTLKPTFITVDTGQSSHGYFTGIIPDSGLVTQVPTDSKPIISDINNDGFYDVLYRNSSGNWFALYHKGEKADLLTTMTDGFGVETKFEYKSLSDASIYPEDGSDWSSVFPVADTRSAQQVVSKYQMSNGIGGFNNQTFSYAGAKVHLQGRGFMGFEQRTITDEDTGIQTQITYNQDLTTDDQGTEVPSFGLIGSVAKIEVLQSSGQPIQELENFYSHKDLGNGTFLPSNHTQELTRNYDLNGQIISAQKIESNFDDYGNLTNQTIEAGSDWSLNGSTPQINNLQKRITVDNTSINNDTSNWILGFVDSKTVMFEVPGETTRQTTTSFVQQIGTLDPLSITEYDGVTNLQRTTSYNRDSFGNIRSVTLNGANFDTRTVISSSNFLANRFPQTVSNALGHIATATYDERFGRSKSISDANNLTSLQSYDSFGRTKSQSFPDGTQTNTAFNYCSPTITCPQGAYFRITAATTNGALSGQLGAPKAIDYFDQLGRIVRNEMIDLLGNSVFVDSVYDSRGYLKQQSQPFFAGTPSQDISWSIFNYDVLGRLSTELSPEDNLTTYTYQRSGPGESQVHVSQAVSTPDGSNLGNRIRQRFYNSTGELITSVNPDDVSTSYRYDAHGNLRETEVANNSATRISITHDLAGNKLNLDDPDTGSIDYTYNALSELKSQTDARDIVSSYTYDLLGRIETRSSPEGVNSWSYDQGTKAVGKLSSVSSAGFGESYSYDSFGRLETTSTTLSGRSTPYVFNYNYDAFSRLNTTEYPSGFQTRQHYSPTGFRDIIFNDIDNAVIWEAQQTDAYGKIALQRFGNGLATLNTYSENTGRLESITTGADSNSQITGSIQFLDYTWDSLGNNFERRSRRGGAEDLRETFSYDEISRLKVATTTGLSSGTRTLSYDYDTLGNMLTKSDVSNTNGYKYGSACSNFTGSQFFPLHGVCEIQGTQNKDFAYDDSGNMTANDNRSIQYSSFNKPTLIDEASGLVVTQFKYDTNDQRFYQRVTSSSNSIDTYYVGRQFEEVEDVGAGTVRYKNYIDGVAIKIYEKDLVTNTITDEKMLYLHSDHLGSIESITDEQGLLVVRNAHDPFGNRRESNWENVAAPSWASIFGIAQQTTTQGFTGHEHLDKHNLVHMGGRIYDPEIGRFMSADPFVQAPAFAQSYNRYSYTWNNPMSFVDPTGYTHCGIDDTNCKHDRITTPKIDTGFNESEWESRQLYLQYIRRLNDSYTRTSDYVSKRSDYEAVPSYEMAMGGVAISPVGVDFGVVRDYSKILRVLKGIPSARILFNPHTVLFVVLMGIPQNAAIGERGCDSSQLVCADGTVNLPEKPQASTPVSDSGNVSSPPEGPDDDPNNGDRDPNEPRTRADLDRDLKSKGFKHHSTSAKGYTTYKGPNGVTVTVKPSGEVIRVQRVWKADGSGKFPQRQNYNGKVISDQSHSTGHFVEPFSGPPKP